MWYSSIKQAGVFKNHCAAMKFYAAGLPEAAPARKEV